MDTDSAKFPEDVLTEWQYAVLIELLRLYLKSQVAK